MIFSIIILWALIGFNQAFALDSDPSIDAEIRYQELSENLDKFKKEVGTYRVQRFEDKNHKTGTSLSPSDRKKKKEYLTLKQTHAFWQKVTLLKRDLVKNYLQFNPSNSTDTLRAVQIETNNLALTLINGTARLKKSYKIGSFPIVHNFLIDLKIKKRGACKHWAEDLLEIINGVDHPHFISYWGEAHPGTILEHNVAVLVPLGASFEEGILIDPWRTAGEPFWTVVKDDHSPWQVWEGYNPR